MKNEEKATKVYLILYNSHEFDDMDEGKDDIVFASLDKEKAMEKFRQGIENIKTNRPWYAGSDYEEEDDNTDKRFSCYWGKYCYTFKFVEQKLEEGGEE